jgi:glycosyltransferase involved in cell wall biosynthesis
MRDEFSVPVKEFLQNIDIMLFFIDFTRQEPFARVVAEGMASGCPIVATDVDGGNRMQVIDGNNGFLCANTNEFYEKLVYLINNPEMIKTMGKNSILQSKFISSEFIINKLMMFIGA